MVAPVKPATAGAPRDPVPTATTGKPPVPAATSVAKPAAGATAGVPAKLPAAGAAAGSVSGKPAKDRGLPPATSSAAKAATSAATVEKPATASTGAAATITKPKKPKKKPEAATATTTAGAARAAAPGPATGWGPTVKSPAANGAAATGGNAKPKAKPATSEPPPASAKPKGSSLSPPGAAASAGILTAEEQALSCKRMTGRMQVRILELRGGGPSRGSSGFAQGLQSAVVPVFGGSSHGSDSAGQRQQDVARLAAMNDLLKQRNCPHYDLADELAKPAGAPTPRLVKPEKNG